MPVRFTPKDSRILGSRISLIYGSEMAGSSKPTKVKLYVKLRSLSR